jgi:hypothetical protein
MLSPTSSPNPRVPPGASRAGWRRPIEDRLATIDSIIVETVGIVRRERRTAQGCMQWLDSMAIRAQAARTALLMGASQAELDNDLANLLTSAAQACEWARRSGRARQELVRVLRMVRDAVKTVRFGLASAIEDC